ncbi:MAG: acetyltransferase [Novosphingobium sp.]
MISIRPSRPDDGKRALEIWASAVDATHHFLTHEDRLAIGREVADFLPETQMTLAVDKSDLAMGFMIVDGGNIEALFVDAACHGQGVGKALIEHATKEFGARRLEVNEQNAGARGFYQRMGFVETGRMDVDGQGRPYPLIVMELPA